MSYTPIDSEVLHPGMEMSRAIDSIGQNQKEVYKFAACLQAFSGAPAEKTAGSTPANDYATKFYVRTRGNADHQSVRWYYSGYSSLSGGSSAGDIRFVGTWSSGSVSVGATLPASSSANEFSYLTANTSGADTVIDWEIQIKNTNGSAKFTGFMCMYYPNYSTTGTLASGYTTWSSSIDDWADPISSEMAYRLMSTAEKIAKDRPTTLFCFFNPELSDGEKTIVANSTSYETVIDEAFRGDGYLRTYRIDVHMSYDPGDDGSGGYATPTCRVSLGGAASSLTFTGVGWKTNTFTSSDDIISVTVDLLTSNTRVRPHIDTIMIRREPS